MRPTWNSPDRVITYRPVMSRDFSSIIIINFFAFFLIKLLESKSYLERYSAGRPAFKTFKTITFGVIVYIELKPEDSKYKLS